MNLLVSRLAGIVGAMFVLLGVSVNKYVLCWFAHRRPNEIQPDTQINILIIQGICVLIGAAMIARRPLSRVWRQLRGSAVVQWLTTGFDTRAVIAVVPIAAASVMFQTVGCWRDELPLWSPVVATSVAESASVSCLLLLLIGGVLVRLSGCRGLLLVAAAFWAVVIPVEMLVVFYGGGRFDSAMLGGISRESVANYVSVWTAGVWLIGAGLVFGGAWLLLSRIGSLATWSGMARLAAWLVLIVALQPSYIVYRALGLPLKAIARQRLDSQRELVRYYAADPVARTVWILVTPVEFRLTSNIGPSRQVIEQMRLPMADPNVPGLELAPFRRVVLIMCESLSLPLISRHNPALPGQLTPVLDALPVGSVRVRTSSLFTTQGLASHYCSHPNHRLLLAQRHPNSFVDILRRRGWRTVLFNSCSRYFDSAYRRFSEIGFAEHYSREWHEAIPAHRRYINGWGICDRLTFGSAADYLKRHRSERVFLTVLTVDTHPPYGRQDYGDLIYPAEPSWITRFPAAASLLRSVFRFDHDLGRFVDVLRKDGLLDEQTLLIITADHCCASDPQYLAVPGTINSPHERIPFVLVSGRKLPKLDPEREGSQLSTAPTVFHLLGIPAPISWWGRSLYDPVHVPPIFVGSFRDQIQIGMPGEPAPAVDAAAAYDFFNTLVREHGPN